MIDRPRHAHRQQQAGVVGELDGQVRQPLAQVVLASASSRSKIAALICRTVSSSSSMTVSTLRRPRVRKRFQRALQAHPRTDEPTERQWIERVRDAISLVLDIRLSRQRAVGPARRCARCTCRTRPQAARARSRRRSAPTCRAPAAAHASRAGWTRIRTRRAVPHPQHESRRTRGTSTTRSPATTATSATNGTTSPITRAQVSAPILDSPGPRSRRLTTAARSERVTCL